MAKRAHRKSPKPDRVYHVLSTGEAWQVRAVAAQRAYRTLPSQKAAIAVARKLAQAGTADAVIIHKRDGTILRQMIAAGKGKAAGVRKTTEITHGVGALKAGAPALGIKRSKGLAGLKGRDRATVDHRLEDEFEADLDYLLEKNAELYRRLAR